MEAVQNLAPHQQQAFMKEMENMQLKDSLWCVFLFLLCLRCIYRGEANERTLLESLSPAYIPFTNTPYVPLQYIISMYNNVVSRCFDGCVSGFRSKSLDKSEVKCVEQCAGRYIKMTQRVGLRFAEHQALQQKRAEDQMGAAAGK